MLSHDRIRGIFNNNWKKVKAGTKTWEGIIAKEGGAISDNPKESLKLFLVFQKRQQWREATLHAPIDVIVGTGVDRRRKPRIKHGDQ